VKFSTWEDFNLETDENTIVVIAGNLPLHEKLRIKRQVEGLTQQQLADILGIGYFARVSDIEKEKKSIEKLSYLQVERIKKYLYEEEYRNGKLVESN